jgi:hypothetical protein
MRGDLSDFVFRLSAVLPGRWFAEQSPILNSLLTSIATPWVWLHGFITYVILQTRLATATCTWLDLIAIDYFGNAFGRKTAESDFSYRSRIQAALLREAATRSAVEIGLASLTGTPPIIFEPANCMDTGSYGVASQNSVMLGTGMAYSEAGGWGSLQLPLQFFVTVARPVTPGVGLLAGYGTSNGAYGAGAISYVDLNMLPGAMTDADIQGTLSRLLPINAVAWLRII